MRIGMVVPCLGFAGGIERHAWNLANGLRGRGYETILLHGPGRGREAETYARPFLDVRPFRHERCAEGLDVAWVHRVGDVAELGTLGTLPVFIAAHDHDLTCVRRHRYLPVGNSPCHRAPGITCVGHGCVILRERQPGGLPLRLGNPFSLRRRLKALCRRGTLVANSRYVAGRLVDAGADPSRIEVVYPVPPDSGCVPKPLPAEVRLLVVGQLLRGKGIDLAIDALATLDRAAELHVVGSGPSAESLEVHAARVAPGCVHFHGYADPERMDKIYDHSRVVLVPSRWPEPFGMVGLEAMRRGRPVVGAGHGGIPEWLADGVAGKLFAPGSVRDLARSIRLVLEQREMGQHAFESASSRFPFTRLLDQVEALLAASRVRTYA